MIPYRAPSSSRLVEELPADIEGAIAMARYRLTRHDVPMTDREARTIARALSCLAHRYASLFPSVGVMPARGGEERMTPTETLVTEILVARHRLGEAVWTFRSNVAVRKALDSLAERGLVYVMHGVTEGTVRGGLTEKGIEVFLSEQYEAPALSRLRDEVEKLREERDEARQNGERFRSSMYAVEEAAARHRTRAEAAEAEVEKQGEALRRIVEMGDYVYKPHEFAAVAQEALARPETADERG